MVVIIVLLLAIFVMTANVIYCFRVTKLFQNTDVVKYWWLMFVLICFFLGAYLVYFYNLLLGSELVVDINNIIISQILFWGAIFVLISLNIFNRCILMIKKNHKKLNTLNQELLMQLNSLKEKNKHLTESQKKLETILDSYYSLENEIPCKK